MAPSVPHIAAQLRQLIYYHLDNSLLRNALFLAGRLVAYEPRSAEAAYLLALCQYQSGLVKAAWDTCRPHIGRGPHLGCAYIYAHACLDLGRNVEGLAALDKATHLWRKKNHWNQHSELRRQHLPDEPAVLCLKGKLWKGHKNMASACECWANALRLNPFMWDAFMNLCDAGAEVNASNIFKMDPTLAAIMQKSENESTALGKEKAPTHSTQSAGHSSGQGLTDPFGGSTRANGMSNHSNTVLGEKWNGSKVSINTVSTIHDDEVDTPLTVVDIDDSMLRHGGIKPVWEPPPAPPRKARSSADADAELGAPPKMKVGSMRSRTRAKGVSEEANVLHDPALPPPASKRTISGQVAPSSMSSQVSSVEGTRRSNRLNTARPTTAVTTTSSKMVSLTNPFSAREGREIKKPKAPVVKGRIATAATVGRVVSGNRTRTDSSDKMDLDSKEHPITAVKIPDVPPLPVPKLRSEPVINKDIEALQALFDLFTRIANGQLYLTHYDCQAAIQQYNGLPSAHRETSYIMAQIGKAYYEQGSYAEAERYFIRLRNMAPSQLEEMEVYSTVLWHMKNDIELAYLAHELTEIDRLSPQAWCAIGNSFSLQREHEQALKCFRRATQLDPLFAYGFTLQGHEYVSNEEFEKALDAYRCAIAADSRHYNAWYGLGKVYEKMGKWKIAEQHYRTAATINPTNAVLICCIGVVLEKLKQPEDALENYTRACVLAPSSALSRFKKARCLMALGRLREALAELKVLKDMVPDEANVHFLLGRVYKALRVKGEAVRAFTMALNLDPKAAQFIKDAMESLDDEDEDDGDDDDDLS